MPSRQPDLLRCGVRTVSALLLLPLALEAQSAVGGVVRDSLAGQPFSGASVQLLRESAPWEAGAVAQTDSAGRYSLAGVGAGRYLLGFQHPRLEALGFDAVTRVIEVPAGGAPVVADLALPSARTLAASICGERVDTTGVVLGRLRVAASGAPSVGGQVEVEWGEMLLDSTGLRPTRARVRSVAGVDGRFVACGVPTNVPILLHAIAADSAQPASSGTIELAFTDGAPLIHRDILLSDVLRDSATTPLTPTSGDTIARRTAQRGTASISGQVFAPGGQPLPGARVRVRDARVSDSYVTTDSAGRFRMSSLPPGTFPLEVIALGFTPTSVPVDLRPASTTPMGVTIRERVASLDAVTVYETRSRAAAGFEKRRLQKRGYFLTGDEIRARSTLLSFVLLSAPSLRVTGMQFGRPILRGYGNCRPSVYLDGFPVVGEDADDLDRLISTRQIGGVEVYTNSFEAPAEFGQTLGRVEARNLGAYCSSIVLWSRMLVPR